MPKPFYSMTERCDLAQQEMRDFLTQQAEIEQTVDQFLARLEVKRAEIVSRHLPLTPQDFAAMMLMLSHRPMPYAVATGDSLGDVVKQYARFYLRTACQYVEDAWADDISVHAELADLGRIV